MPTLSDVEFDMILEGMDKMNIQQAMKQELGYGRLPDPPGYKRGDKLVWQSKSGLFHVVIYQEMASITKADCELLRDDGSFQSDITISLDQLTKA